MSDHSHASPRLTELLGLVGLFAVGVAWLLPNKAFPWVSIWNEASAVCGLLMMALLHFGRAGEVLAQSKLAWPLTSLVSFGVAAAWIQWMGGLLPFAGDAWIVSLYLGLFAMAVLTGQALACSVMGGRWTTALLLTVLSAGLISAGIVLMQWLWTEPLVVFAQELVRGSRPYASLGQQNHTNTLFFLALCCGMQLRHERQIGAFGMMLSAAVLTLAMCITQSRTGLLQLALLAGWCVWLWLRAGQRGEWRWGLWALGLGAVWWLAMPWLDQHLLLPWSARDVGLEQAGGDLRLKVWHAFFDAALQRPWTGYGWLQSATAQEAVAACHPDLRYYFNYAHMLALDWVVWLGWPLGLSLLALLAWWVWRHLSAQGSAASGYWMAAVLGLLLHAMLEYPLAYTYFLLPMGLMMGVIDARDPVHRALRLGPGVFGLGWLALCALSAAVVWDVGRATSTYTDIRFENARIGAVRHAVEVPDLLLLDHLHGLLALTAADVSKPVTQQVLEEYGGVARRLPSPTLLRRYATLLEVSGQPDEAARQQQLLCDVFGAVRCQAEAKGWQEWQRDHGLPMTEFKGRVLGPRCAAAAAPR
ncbi:MAG: O-antigen ligase C-terminal domain-containing protein [Proteobacteria bacterium]|nr:O-antigen ligase C-terminal domain-containing protein [Pseudomonadota bacterium]